MAAATAHTLTTRENTEHMVLGIHLVFFNSMHVIKSELGTEARPTLIRWLTYVNIE